MIFNLPKYFTRKDAQVCGVYFMIRKGKIVYIGKSIDVFTRVFYSNSSMKGKFDYVRIIPCSPDKLCSYEKRWIIKFRPKHNHAYLFSWRGPHFTKKKRVAVNVGINSDTVNTRPYYRLKNIA